MEIWLMEFTSVPFLILIPLFSRYSRVISRIAAFCWLSFFLADKENFQTE